VTATICIALVEGSSICLAASYPRINKSPNLRFSILSITPSPPACFLLKLHRQRQTSGLLVSHLGPLIGSNTLGEPIVNRAENAFSGGSIPENIAILDDSDDHNLMWGSRKLADNRRPLSE
jgi:hypothetical protein